jgi:hypothetical protein
VTDELRKFRKQKADDEAKNKTGWCSAEVQAKCKSNNTQRGVQGYYFNKSLQKYVWLRSTYEYIYAKWLDKQKVIWDVEVKTYNMNGILYRPDFFIYSNYELIKIVEIKGFWRDKEYKSYMLNDILKTDVVVITDIDQYIEIDSNYNKQLYEWKNKRILKLN